VLSELQGSPKLLTLGTVLGPIPVSLPLLPSLVVGSVVLVCQTGSV
jgi:hypothetical protein